MATEPENKNSQASTPDGESADARRPSQLPDGCSPELLAGLMSLADVNSSQPTAVNRPLWSSDELAPIWRHQLAAPLLLDLCGVNHRAPAVLHAAIAPGLTTFGDLLSHPRPPIEVLELVKTFGKSQRFADTGGFPMEIAGALYYLAITLALVRLGQRISAMDSDKIRRGLQWNMQQPWIDSATRELFDQGLQWLNQPRGF